MDPLAWDLTSHHGALSMVLGRPAVWPLACPRARDLGEQGRGSRPPVTCLGRHQGHAVLLATCCRESRFLPGIRTKAPGGVGDGGLRFRSGNRTPSPAGVSYRAGGSAPSRWEEVRPGPRQAQEGQAQRCRPCLRPQSSAQPMRRCSLPPWTLLSLHWHWVCALSTRGTGLALLLWIESS